MMNPARPLNFSNLLHAYRSILRWNGESANELLNMLSGLVQTTPLIFLQPLPAMLASFRYNRGLRFDTSRISEPILVVDKRGEAIVGTLRAMKLERLMRI